MTDIEVTIVLKDIEESRDIEQVQDSVMDALYFYGYTRVAPIQVRFVEPDQSR